MASRRRTVPELIEVGAPALAASLVRLVGRLPRVLRRRALEGAFGRAAGAFNRGDLEALFALFADDVEYVPPPALRPPDEMVGRDGLIEFWREALTRYPDSRITNLSLAETERDRFTRTARVSHRGPGRPELTYEIRQLTVLRHGRVVRQVNDAA